MPTFCRLTNSVKALKANNDPAQGFHTLKSGHEKVTVGLASGVALGTLHSSSGLSTYGLTEKGTHMITQLSHAV